MKTFKLYAYALAICLFVASCADDRTAVDESINNLKAELGVNDILEDIKVPVKSGTASSFQSGEGIEKSFDGDFSTIYHSKWDNEVANYYPITLTYNFEDASSIDYLVYHPRTSGSNGNFKEFDLYIATKEKPTLTKYGSYDFKGSSSASRIDFKSTILNPLQIQFVVKSGYGDGNGFASCSEMEFYQKNDNNFNFLSIFTDQTCTELRPEITENAIKAIGNQFFRELAMEIYTGTYNKEFRIQEYKAWQHPDVMAKLNKTSTYGLRDNPTGIYAEANEDIVIFTGDLHNQNIAIFIQEPGKKLGGSSYPLASGLNKFKAKNSGLLYVMYYTNTGTENPIKLNIATGKVNGYFDKNRHTRADWTRLLSNATFKDFDVKGDYAVLTFRTDAFRQYTTDGLALINKFDDLVYQQQEFMGLVKYNKMYKNRAYFLVVEDGYMYAGGYHTGYHTGTQEYLLNPSTLSTSGVWGPSHELGHTHQTRPGMRWAGMAEVTNNIHSLHIQTLWGNKSRLIADERYEKGFSSTIAGRLALNEEPDVFCRLIPFWQLKLYLMDILDKKDFYKDMYEYMRITPDVTTNSSNHGLSQLQFVKAACDIAKLDLTEFFETWGFLRPINKTVDDYSSYAFKITQAEIDNLKAQIAAKGYAKPKHKLQYITDENVSLYKNNSSVVKGTTTAIADKLELNGWSNVVAYEVYKNNVLQQVACKSTITFPSDISEYEIWAVGADGSKIKVAFTVSGDIKIGVKSAEASSFQAGEGIEKSIDGNLSTLYHSSWNNDIPNYMPITLTYNFSNIPSMDYLVYTPRTSGTNGNFKEFDLYIATSSNPTLTKYGSYDFKGSRVPSKITFSPALVNPTRIEFVVKSGAGAGPGFVSCAEMGFFRKR